ncbi:phage tail sheath family protein [Paraburkholderia phytofirmans]|uniref:Phage tail protein n=1 Tax=Paraburkholderia phytofirmans OLGA172 TaxID=1417228 RepID=A0A160FNM5_9BURK|nr:phage tail sheath C-terminal domain-containing protein [Paraburkholderia phytofirmans]ANB73898.1 phage tail protein [Paraburkholderia phytofirmans OLGA172]
MPTTVSYPGIYIEEDASPSLSVSASATAVPIIAVNSWKSAAVKFNSYLEFISSIGSWGSGTTDMNLLSVRAYFESGGGPCYVVNYGNLATEVPKYSDITLIVAAGRDINSAVTALCTSGSGLFAIFDGPQAEITDGNAASNFPSTPHAAVYYPWLSVDWTTGGIPPSAVAAGLYCQSDRTRGVWKAPANISIAGNYKPLFKVSDDLQGQYNQGKAINMIRDLDGRGPVIWGARTLEDSDDWRYISVRRLFNSAERDIKNAMQPMVFEPNNSPTWEKVRSAVTNYLHSLWRQGALVGTTEKDAYFVAIGEGTSMTADDIAQGKMIVKVGMAAVRPAEFIILQFTQNVAAG